MTLYHSLDSLDSGTEHVSRVPHVVCLSF